ncbi:hypothetical protein BIY24_13225 [Halobacteriovorax marinus]|uniref:Exported protein n=1 Tax=Halobacteriovorax marinus (strain ATCC BAA-682 / DSM 15412 / SJ) TaxID=862908 RepID=E1WY22_HALMS|nr:hypothetical protein [Halobacteriovorax marinus]ATH08873.1 hypothetical protein BIY24_13225 [Halobacteriovorax marinus]CBW27577.1 putative exported protein [Halobacteriovorax marinus SJ]
MIKYLAAISLLLSLNSFADCEKEYNKFKLIALTEPITTPIRTGLYFSSGAISSTGASLIGTLALNLELSTAGVLYGAAFTYEGTYFIKATIANFRKFKGRAHAQKLIIESKIGLGDTLEEFIDDVNEALSDYILLSKEQVIEEVLLGNTTFDFCQSRETMFTINNIKNHIIRKYTPQSDIEPDYDDDLDIDIIDGGYEL